MGDWLMLNYVSVGVFVCLFVCVLEPLHFLWKYRNFDDTGLLWLKYVLELCDYVSVCLFVGLFVLKYVLDLSV